MAKRNVKKPIPVQPVVASIKESFYQKSETWLGKKQKLIITAILVFSVVFRIGYFLQLNSGPCIWQHRYEESDMNFYDEWAKIIANGNWLSNLSFHQFDAGHQWIADYYFKTHPDEAVQMQKQLGNDKSPEALARLLWHRWDGGKIFHQDPLYIYFIAVIYKFFGPDVRYVFVLQMVIGIFSVLLIYLLTRKYFGNIAALFSGILALFCGPLMFYELVLVRESVIVFAGLLLVYLMEKAFENRSGKNFFILGCTIAICMLLKSTFILFLLLTIAASFFVLFKQFKIFIRYSGILLAGALIIYSPLILRNSIVGVPLLSQNCVGAISVIASNDVNYKPEESYVLNLKNTTEILDKTGGKTLPTFYYAIKTHPDLISYFTLLAKKFLLVFHWYEFPNNKNFYYYRLHAPLLCITFSNMLVIAPLAFAGICISVLQKRKLWSLYLLLLMHLLLLVAFIVLSRYRIPFQAALIPFAGFAISEIIKNFQTKLIYALGMVVVIALAVLWVGRSLPKNITLIRGVDFQQPYRFYYKQIIDDEVKNGNIKGALSTMHDLMKFEPEDVKKLNASSVSLNNYEVILTTVFSDFHDIYSKLFQLAGNEAKAKAEKDRGDELRQLYIMNDNSGSLDNLVAKAAAAPPDQKVKLYRDLIEPLWNEIKLNPNNTGPYYSLNESYLQLQLPDSSIFVLQQLLKINSNDFTALFQLGTIYGRYKNDLNNSVFYLEKAKSIEPKSEDVCLNLGIVYGLSGQNEKAIEMMQMVANLNPNNKNNLRNLELLLRKLGRTKEADEVKIKI